MNRNLLATVVFVAAFGLWGAKAAHAQDENGGQVRGAVSAQGPDGQPFRIPGVVLRLSPSAGNPIEGVSDDRGEFEFVDLAPGTYALEAQLDGFGAFSASVSVTPGATASREVTLQLAGVSEEVVVTANDPGELQTDTAPPVTVAQQTMQQVPIASESFQAAMPLVPGVVRGKDGLLSIKGAREDQSSLRVGNANVADPVTGEFAFRLPLEAVASMEVVTSPYAAEFGQVNGGVTKIETSSGTAKWRVQAQNIEPRLRRRNGEVRGIESWTPRVAVGGPMVPNRLAVFNALEYRFTRSLVRGLPEGDADTEDESLSDFLKFDWAASPSDHLSTAVAIFPQKNGFLGLDSFNPPSVTPNLRQRAFLWTATERRVLDANHFLEANGSVRQIDTDVFASTGGPAMVLAPGRNRGSYFNHQSRDSRRYEGLVEYSLVPSASAHLVKVGVGVSHDAYEGVTSSQPVLIVRTDGSLAERIDYLGSADLSRQKTDVQAFVQDNWKVVERITLDFGVRYDRDGIASDHHVSPRLGFSFVPGADRRTVVRGGAGLFYDKITLNAATFSQQPARLISRFAADGQTLLRPATLERPNVADGRLRNPESVAWNVEVDRELSARWMARAAFQQRTGSRQLIVDPQGNGPDGALVLANSGRSRYRELELTGRYLAGGQSMVVSYVRSATTGDLNNLNAFFANVQDPVIRLNEDSRLPSDAPHRLLAWGELDLPAGFGLAPLVEVRSGFPYSVYDEYHDFVGPRNQAGRFPTFFSLDVQVWKTISLPVHGLKARIGAKVFNITNHFNPRDVDSNLTSPGSGAFSNQVTRTFRGKFVVDF